MNFFWFLALVPAIAGMDITEVMLSEKQSKEVLRIMYRLHTRVHKMPPPVMRRGDQETVDLDTTMGRLRGVVNKTVRKNVTYAAFYGVPYAEPPVGRLRFRAPVPAKPWKGVYDATFERPCCMQNGETPYEDEDCLYLNVYTPRPSDSGTALPVMVFIHGGAFVGGSSSTKMYAPDFVVDTGVILVTLNYRLGALGFLSMQTPEVPGNAGLKDQALALKWVKENIRCFGGDPMRVTVFGESAGAASIHYHMLSKRSKGLFDRAILESGTANCPWAFLPGSEAKKKAVSLARKLSCWTLTDAMTLDCLMKKSAKEITEKQAKAVSLGDLLSMRPFAFVPTQEPVFDDALISEDPDTLIAKEPANPVPAILGSNSREALIVWPVFEKIDPIGLLTWLIGWDLSLFYPAHLLKKLPLQKKRLIHYRLKEFYFGENSVGKATLGNLIDLITDSVFVVPIQRASARLANGSSPVYNYVFAFDGPYGHYKREFGLTNERGVSHADELGYLFYDENIHPQYPIRGGDESILKAETTVEKMTKMWSNFAASGDPTPVTNELLNEKWLPRTASHLTYVTIGDNLLVRDRDFKTLIERVHFWKNLVAEIGE
ncbi:UNVERIFIED_CONTAM: hypothetical protein PYX00_006708 [Menopon gallinae]|uniref:Carboxylic ester hydrolase n=1 Tax=Menopon gallinae TaxID=328185 RepID=A0AAW2HWC7_9NEOP